MSKPIFKVRSGNISASIFKNSVEKDKKKFEFFTIALQRSYKKEDSPDWINEHINLRKNDLHKLLIVLDKVSDELFVNKDEVKEIEE